MKIMFRGQVKSTFVASEKNKTYVSCFDLDNSSDVNFVIEGTTDLHKGDQIENILTVESSVYKGMNTLIIKNVAPIESKRKE